MASRSPISVSPRRSKTVSRVARMPNHSVLMMMCRSTQGKQTLAARVRVLDGAGGCQADGVHQQSRHLESWLSHHRDADRSTSIPRVLPDAGHFQGTVCPPISSLDIELTTSFRSALALLDLRYLPMLLPQRSTSSPRHLKSITTPVPPQPTSLSMLGSRNNLIYQVSHLSLYSSLFSCLPFFVLFTLAFGDRSRL